jgi:hypothetical protein
LFFSRAVISSIIKQGQHDRYTPVSYDDDQVVVMDTHTGQVWSAHYEAKEATSLKIFNPKAGELQVFPKRLSAKRAE